jgi:tRNA modification GTPase
MLFDDTICAISTAQGVGGIAVIRVSGSDAKKIVAKVFKSKSDLGKANTVVFGNIEDNGEVVDEVLVSIFNNPKSFTGEDVLEISCHGSKYIQHKILQLLIENGCRMAEAGEFSKRAFLNGKMDLSQTEAIADLIHSGSEISHRIAMQQLKGGFAKEFKTLREQLLHFVSLVELELDFSEEDVEFADRVELKNLIIGIKDKLDSLKNSFKLGNAIKEGVPVAIVGNTNSGKSTLLNCLLNEEKAIVSDVHGTTRDVIEDSININGLDFRFIDTAGIRETSDKIEQIGIERTYQNIEKAQVVILVLDRNESQENNYQIVNNIKSRISEEQNLVILVNKLDTGVTNCKFDETQIEISAKQKLGIEKLTERLTSFFNIENEQNSIVVSNMRHYEIFVNCSESAQTVIEGLDTELPTDLLAMDIREIINLLGQITGEIDVEEVLGNIFKNFCIGK